VSPKTATHLVVRPSAGLSWPAALWHDRLRRRRLRATLSNYNSNVTVILATNSAAATLAAQQPRGIGGFALSPT